MIYICLTPSYISAIQRGVYMYITSARGHELSGRSMHTHIIKIMSGRGLQKKL